jgi:hypothetical protein
MGRFEIANRQNCTGFELAGRRATIDDRGF